MYNYSVKLTIHGMFPPAGRKKRQTAFGTVWFSTVKGNAGSPTGFLHGMTICILPDILPDLTTRRVKEFV